MRELILAIVAGCLTTTVLQADESHDRFVDRVVSFEAGDGGGHNETKLPHIVLGAPRGGGKLKPSGHVLSLGRGGRITLEFVDNEVIDGPGPDVLVFENPFLELPGNDPSLGHFELAKIEFSADGETWHEVPYDTGTRKGCAGHRPVLANADENDIDPADPEKAGGDPFDLKDVGLKSARFIRITDMGNAFGEKGTAGFDLDAVVAVNARPLKKEAGSRRQEAGKDGVTESSLNNK